MEKFDFIDYAVVDRVAEITMKRAPVNAINHDLIRDILDGYRKAREDDGVGAIILTSSFQNVFSAGMDLKMARTDSGLKLKEFLEVFYFDMHLAQYRFGKPTIAAVTGAAKAAGVTLAVSCDCIIASETAEFAYPEINVGVIPAMHFVHLPREIGRHRAFELLFTGDTISASEMFRMGVINRVVPPDRLMEEARILARKFAAKSPVIMKLARDSFMRANDIDYRRNIENVVETAAVIKETEDSREALDAFVEHRSPVYKGK
jgi:enoyl-CoA hydratase/carnithine racemase